MGNKEMSKEEDEGEGAQESNGRKKNGKRLEGEG